MAANASPSEVECTCPVCCDIFKDPVVLLCGHSFCKHCLQEWWRQSRLQMCPVCKEIFPMAQPPRNLALRNLSDNLRRERRSNPESKEICSLHSEKLKLFCQDDKHLICVICRDAQKHKKHNCIPVNEAADEYKTKVKVQLVNLQSKLGSFNREKLKCDKMAGHIKLQAQQTVTKIQAEFQKLYKFLRAEETARIDAVRKEATVKSEALNIRIVNLTAEISSLTEKIKKVQKEMKAEDISFMLNIRSTMEQSQCKLPEPATPSGALIDEAKHLGNVLFTVWTKMKNIIQYSPVTLDPNTSSSQLIISEHMTRSTVSDKSQPLPENPERMYLSVLGSGGFISGKHSWDVEVGGYWSVGVAARTNDESKIWSIYMCVCTDILRERTPENDVNPVLKDLLPQKVRVQLDYDQGMLSFFDIDKKTPVHTIRYTFTEELFPYFHENAKILPADFSVKIRQPR